MIIRLTDEMAKKIGVSPENALERSDPSFCDWTVRPFRFGRIQDILAANTSSLFSVCFPAKGSTNPQKFIRNFKVALQEIHGIYGLSLTYNDTVEPSLGDIAWSKVGDKRLNGTMTENVHYARAFLADGEMPCPLLSMKINNNINRINDYRPPCEIYLQRAQIHETSISEGNA